MKKPNLAATATAFAIQIEPIDKPKDGPENPDAEDDQVYYKVRATDAQVEVTFSVPKGTAEDDVVGSAKRRIANELARTELQGLLLDSERAEFRTPPIGCLRVSLQLPTRDAIEQIVEQSARTAK